MEGREILRDVAVLLAASLPVLFLCRRLRLPQIAGFLVTGIAIGPHALGLLSDPARVEGIADLGVVLILFFVGLHFPLEKLFRLGRTALVGGTLQIALTTLAVAALRAAFLGQGTRQAVFYGLIASLSSTAVILPLLQSRDELAAPYGRRFLGVALFQDLAVIPIVLLLPALAPSAGGGAPPSAVAVRVGVAVASVVALVAAARFLAPKALDAVVRLGSRESFTGGVIVLVLGLIAVAEQSGVSAAMGAFAAGIVLGESEHVHEVAATLAPFRDLLSSLFFVSIGMLLDPRFVLGHPLEIGAVVVTLLLVKSATGYVSLRAAGTVPRTALRAALLLAPIGEFSFLIATAGGRLGLLDSGSSQVFLATAVLTLAGAPFLVPLGLRLERWLADRVEPVDDADADALPPSRHIVVVGYGLNGRSVSRVLKETGIPHLVVEIEPERVALARRDGVRVIRAEATGAEAMDAAGVSRARGVVVTIADADGARRITRLARQRNPDARILVRTRYIAEVDALRDAGADEVIPEEFETSIEIVSRVLRLLHVPGNLVAAQIRLLRDEGYRKLRDPRARVADGRRLSALLAGGTTELFLVLPDTAADRATVDRLGLDADHVVVPALLRDGQPHAPVPRDMEILAGDTLLLAGAHEDLARVLARLERTATVPHPRPEESTSGSVPESQYTGV